MSPLDNEIHLVPGGSRRRTSYGCCCTRAELTGGQKVQH